MLCLSLAYQKSKTHLQTIQEDHDIVMLMYNLLEYSESYSITPESLWNYYRDKVNDDANENNDAGNLQEKYQQDSNK